MAHILNLPVSKVRRWMREYWGSMLESKHKKNYYKGVGKDRTTNFNTLIEFYVFYQLRELKLSPKKIFEAHHKIASHFNTVFPFATSEILANPTTIFVAIDDEVMLDTKNFQTTYKKLMEDFCKKIQFSEDQIAERFYPIGRERKIVVDPEHQFGQPIVEGSNVLAENIFSMYESGEKEEVIGKLFDLTSAEVRDAIKFYQMKAA